MSLWKKVGGAVLSTSLAASLLLTVAGTALANTNPQALAGTCVPTTCSQVAVTGTITMVGRDNTAAGAFVAPTKLTVSGAGATFVHATAPFVLETATVFSGGAFYVAGEVLVPTATANLSAADVTVVGGSAGTATITEWTWIASLGQWAPDGNTWTLTFTAASDFQVSAAKSTVQTVTTTTITATSCGTAQTSEASTTGASTASICFVINNGAGNPLAGVTISGTIQPFGTIAGSQSYTTGATNASGIAALPIAGAGLAGPTTITANASFLGVTTALPSATFTFTGALAKLTLTNVRYIYARSEAVSEAIKVAGTDSAGNNLALGANCAAGDITAATTLTGLTLGAAIDAVDGFCYITATTTAAAAFGSTAITYAVAGASSTITSNSVNLGISDVAATITAAFDKTTVIPGGTAKFMATLKDSAGRMAPDTTVVLSVSSSGVAVDSKGSTTTKTSNGVATYTYLAPFNTGVASVSAFNVDAGSASAAITVGTPQPPSAVTWAPTTSALGNVPASGYTFPTKIQKVGGYITWRVDGGAGLAGKTIQIWVYKKYSLNGAWSPATMLTTRKANADGVAFVNIYTKGVLWISLRPVLPASGDQAASWGPTSIGRWVL